MTDAMRINKLNVPTSCVDVVLDTDAFNEIDDQFAIAYLLRSPERANVVALSAAPFLNQKVANPGEGMEKSYHEIFKILELAGAKLPVWRGSETFLPDDKTPVDSEAARNLVSLAMTYSPEKPLYVIAIGAVTNVASALLLEPAIADRIVLVWLGGQALHYGNNLEFNLRQDVAAGRVVFGSEVPLVQLPCRGVVSQFATTRYELEHWLLGKNPLSDYLASNAIAHCETLAPGKPWSKPLWDVTAVGWLCNDNEEFMLQRIERAPMPEADHRYAIYPEGKLYQYVYYINRDALFEDLVNKLTKDN